METSNNKSSVVNWWSSLSKKSKGWIIGVTICLILACIGYLSNPQSFKSKTTTNPQPSNIVINSHSTSEIEDSSSEVKNSTNEVKDTTSAKTDSASDTKYNDWRSAEYEGISYRIPPGFKENAKKTDENGQPFIQIAKDKGSTYQFEIVYNAVTTYGSYPLAASMMLTLVKSMYFDKTDVNFIAEKIYSKNIGDRTFLVCPSDKSYLAVYFNTHNDDVYCIIALSDNMVEAESFVESIEIQ